MTAGPPPRIRVVLVDDHHLVRAGLEHLLATADDVECVGSAADGAEAVALVERRRPDVVLMDLAMPSTDGVAATRQIVGRFPETRVVVLTSFGDESRIHAALAAGARGYLLKHTRPDELLDAVRAAFAGDAPLDPRAARVLLDRSDPAGPPPGLSPREREVLLLVADGLTNRRIARRLAITERTVKGHMTRILHAIGVEDRLQAALWAREHL